MILVDVSTSYMFRNLNPVGILRAEYEVVAAFEELPNTDVVFGIYDQNIGHYVALPIEEFDTLVRNKDWKTDDLKRAAETQGMGRFSRKAKFMYRLGRCFWQTQRLKKQSVTEPARRERYMAEALKAISDQDYGDVRKWISRIVRGSKNHAGYLSWLDELNWKVTHGTFDFKAYERLDATNFIDPTKVTHFVCAGAFWSDKRYKYVYNAKYNHGWKTHYLIYDLIPILWRHVTEPTTKETFPLALHWVLWASDQLWTISDTTQDALRHYIDHNGYPPKSADAITTTVLGAELKESPPDTRIHRQNAESSGP